MLIYGNGVDEWAIILKNRFKTSKFTGIAAVIKKYTINDKIKCRKPRKYIQTVIRTFKIAGLNNTFDYLLVIWNGVDVEFQ